MATFLLQHPLQNHRGHSESYEAYCRRRRSGNRAVRLSLRGGFRPGCHVSTKIVGPLPLRGVDAQVDKAILDGHLRDAALVRLENGDQHRVARTKGETYRKPQRSHFAKMARHAAAAKVGTES